MISVHIQHSIYPFKCWLFSNIVQEINNPGKIINRLPSTKLLVCGQPHTVFPPNGGTTGAPPIFSLAPPPFECKVNTEKQVFYTVYKTSCTTDVLLHP